MVGEVVILPKPCQDVTSLDAGAPAGKSGPRNELCPVCRTSCWNIGHGVLASWAAAGAFAPNKSAPVSSSTTAERSREAGKILEKPPGASEPSKKCVKCRPVGAAENRNLGPAPQPFRPAK